MQSISIYTSLLRKIVLQKHITKCANVKANIRIHASFLCCSMAHTFYKKCINFVTLCVLNIISSFSPSFPLQSPKTWLGHISKHFEVHQKYSSTFPLSCWCLQMWSSTVFHVWYITGSVLCETREPASLLKILAGLWRSLYSRIVYYGCVHVSNVTCKTHRQLNTDKT